MHQVLDCVPCIEALGNHIGMIMKSFSVVNVWGYLSRRDWWLILIRHPSLILLSSCPSRYVRPEVWAESGIFGIRRQHWDGFRLFGDDQLCQSVMDFWSDVRWRTFLFFFLLLSFDLNLKGDASDSCRLARVVGLVDIGMGEGGGGGWKWIEIHLHILWKYEAGWKSDRSLYCIGKGIQFKSCYVLEGSDEYWTNRY